MQSTHQCIGLRIHFHPPNHQTRSDPIGIYSPLPTRYSYQTLADTRPQSVSTQPKFRDSLTILCALTSGGSREQSFCLTNKKRRHPEIKPVHRRFRKLKRNRQRSNESGHQPSGQRLL
jgi:hypothetical protein